MKTEIQYDVDNKEEADRKALLDTLHWFNGFNSFKTLVRYIKSGCSFKQLAFCASFGGVEGYPVNAMWRRYSEEV